MKIKTLEKIKENRKYKKRFLVSYMYKTFYKTFGEVYYLSDIFNVEADRKEDCLVDIDKFIKEKEKEGFPVVILSVSEVKRVNK